jgi:undecaprenyl-diphosphatase
MAGHTLTRGIIKEQSSRNAVPFDLRSPGVLARWPIIGVLMFVFGILAFGALTYNLYAQGPLLQWDYKLASTLPAIGLQSPPIVKYIMNAGFYLGKEVILVLFLFHAVYFVYKRYWQELTMILVGFFGVSMIFYVISHIINRPRPDTQIWIIVNIPGFPSGHGASVVVFYGLLAYFMLPKVKSALAKFTIIASALAVMIFVGFSRVFTAGHYMTDMLAGYALGIIWVGLAYTLIELYFQRRGNRNVQKG